MRAQGALMPILGMLARKLGVRRSIFIGSFIFSAGIFITNWSLQVISQSLIFCFGSFLANWYFLCAQSIINLPLWELHHQLVPSGDQSIINLLLWQLPRQLVILGAQSIINLQLWHLRHLLFPSGVQSIINLPLCQLPHHFVTADKQ